MTVGNEVGTERATPGPLGTLANGPEANGTGRGPRPGVEAPAASWEDQQPLPEAAGAAQLVEQARSATEVLEQDLAAGLTESAGWGDLLARVRAAAAAQRAIAESEKKLLELRERATAEVESVYQAAADRAEELVFEARSVAAELVQDARAETARVRREAESGAELVRREAETAATTLVGEADREAASKLAGADLTLREQIAGAEREAALILEKSHEQATAWLAEAKQACVEMMGRAREEADRMLEAARDETADASPDARPEIDEIVWPPRGHRPSTEGLTGQTEAPTGPHHRLGITPGEPVIGSRGSTTAFSDGGSPAGQTDQRADRLRPDRGDKPARGVGRRRRFRS